MPLFKIKVKSLKSTVELLIETATLLPYALIRSPSDAPLYPGVRRADDALGGGAAAARAVPEHEHAGGPEEVEQPGAEASLGC